MAACDALAMNVSYNVSGCTAAALGAAGASAEPSGDLWWLWQTMAATSCWAISDVICDACIRPATPAEPAPTDDIMTQAVTSATPPPKHIQRRRRPKPIADTGDDSDGEAGRQATSCSRTKLRAPHTPKMAGFRARPAPPGAADPVVPTSRPEVRTKGCKLTPEQNALVSGCVSLVVAAVAMLPCLGDDARNSSFVSWDMPMALASLGGCFHFSAYLLTLCAFSSVSSTVITPLMQLSAVWMLPFSTLAAAMGLGAFIRPVHLLALALICTGGFLPAAHGSLWMLTTRGFWRQRAIRFVMLGEFLVCCYNLILHQATFAGVNPSASSGGVGATLRFFLASRTANGLTCVLLFCSVPSLRREACAIHKVDPWFLSVSLLGESLSMLGVCLVTFSYASFYEPSVVNAVEGGLQQLFNLMFALLSYRVMGWGRAVEHVPVKCISFVMVATGLTLSAA
eukprot:gnl/TRDRNA2_/TRDRNA2_125388_c0_seq1.p1 gnl/TRDRNA2_/TRDRNA2_125388_c0~~gnl/TRDRNA2_/TRDRNA2_125388_c0_seq1.p1  ORF type:complete len:454 (-),score=36.97 gnl/TRDRNA2_/TRDRNA2_125388_c0_seq1:184-1545(-)